MNTSRTRPTTTAATGDNAPVHIALHFSVPFSPTASRILGLDSPILLTAMMSGVNAALASELPDGQALPLLGDVHDGLVIFETRHPETVLQRILYRLAGCFEFFAPFTTIAHFCPASQEWKVDKSGFDKSDFASRLSEQRTAARQQITAQMLKRISLGGKELFRAYSS